MMYGSCNIKRARQIFFLILGYFLPFYLPNNPENQNFKKMTKTPGDIIILHMSTKNQSHTECDRQTYFLILDHFLPFPPPPIKTQRIKIMKK